MPNLTTAATEKASIEAFKRDVVDASATMLVLVDFWAEWCGPCKTLTPLLERIVAAYPGQVALVKIDVDKNATLASQFRIQSIPTVYAFSKGQPVDGFQGALGEKELKAFIDRLLAAAAPAPPPENLADIEALIAAAGEALAEQAFAEAADMYGALALELPDRHDLAAGLARSLVGVGDLPAAAKALAKVPADSKDAAVAQARAVVTLAQEAGPAGDVAALQAKLAANPDDHATRFELANSLIASRDCDGAATALLDIVRAEPEWNDKAARVRLLKLFEAVGLSDPWTVAMRGRLRNLLYT